MSPLLELLDLVDRRGKHPPPKLYRANRSPRPWSAINGVTLHQTACLLSDRQSRWDTLNAHIGVTRNGTTIVVNPLEWFIWHAQGLSHHTIGIEYCGNFEGVQGDRSTWWAPGGGPHRLTLEQEAASDVLFRWLRQQFEENGAEWKEVHAHRQSCKDRRDDPGSEIWQKVGMVWIERLGATEGGEGWKVGDGRPIPREWNQSYSAEY